MIDESRDKKTAIIERGRADVSRKVRMRSDFVTLASCGAVGKALQWCAAAEDIDRASAAPDPFALSPDTAIDMISVDYTDRQGRIFGGPEAVLKSVGLLAAVLTEHSVTESGVAR
jgi:hypothetical protein